MALLRPVWIRLTRVLMSCRHAHTRAHDENISAHIRGAAAARKRASEQSRKAARARASLPVRLLWRRTATYFTPRDVVVSRARPATLLLLVAAGQVSYTNCAHESRAQRAPMATRALSQNTCTERARAGAQHRSRARDKMRRLRRLMDCGRPLVATSIARASCCCAVQIVAVIIVIIIIIMT